MAPPMKRCLDCPALTPNSRCPVHEKANAAKRIMGRARQEQRRRIIARDGRRCAACGKGPLLDRDIEIDHVRAVAAFPLGTAPAVVNADANMVVSCRACNRAKGSR